MITANHLIYNIIGIATSGGLPSEFKISNEQVLFWINETRSQLISQALSKRDDINDSWIQYIPCVKLELADESECCEYPTGCSLLKSVKKLPSTIDTWKDNSIVSVTTMDNKMISKSNTFRARYQSNNKFTSQAKSWYIKDDYLYVINDKFMEVVNVAGLFETPSDLEAFETCSGEQCFTLDSPYPISLTLSTQLTDIIIKTKVAVFMNFPQDNSNDASSIVPQQALANKQANP